LSLLNTYRIQIAPLTLFSVNNSQVTLYINQAP
jgi:hypothetical protein